MRKKERLNLIKEILVTKKIQKQEELVEILQSYNMSVTQATVSRDIVELKLQKVRDKSGISYYQLPPITTGPVVNNHDFKEALRLIKDIKINKAELMLITTPGVAMKVKYGVLKNFAEDLWVAIADDDGVYLKMRDIAHARSLYQSWQTIQTLYGGTT